MSEHDFLEALRQKYDSQAYVVIPQVRNGTGTSRPMVRTADAIVVSLWPSRGVYAHGFEFKDSRTDWLKELKQPDKAHEIGRFCSRWTLLTSDDSIAKKEEVPDAWGLSVVHESKGIVDVKAAPTRDVDPPTLTFVAAVLRAAKDCVTDEAIVNAKVSKAVALANEGVWRQVEKARRQGQESERKLRTELETAVRDFEIASGVSIRKTWDNNGKKIGEAVKFVLDGGVEGQREELKRILQCCDRIKAAAQSVGQLETEPAA